MKKTLLTLAAITATSLMTFANEHTFVFDGDNDMAGLTRQTTTNEANMTFVNNISFSESGIDFKMEVTEGSGKGYALVNAGGANAGIYISSSVANKIILKVPGGNISKVNLTMSGYAVANLDIDFQGKEIMGENDGSIYNFTWESKDKGPETVNISWPSTFMARYVHSIDVTYTPDLGGKQECGLSFSPTEATAVVGEKFEAPVLSNPNNLPITWSSTNEDVASVDATGKVTPISKGTAMIYASTVGNDKYAAGDARYTLTVIPSASSFKQMMEVAGESFDKVVVNFPATVTYPSGSYAYVIDTEGNAGYILNRKNEGSTSTAAQTIYKVGDIIPAGWTATNNTMYETVTWAGLPEESTETTTVTYQAVSSITPEDVNRVVILKNVTFTSYSPNGTFKGHTPDGTEYQFQDTFNVSYPGEVTRDVTGVVQYSKHGSTVYFYMSPIAYSDPTPDPVFPESFDITISDKNLSLKQGMDMDVYTVNVTGKSDAASVTLTFAVPEGWDGFINFTNEEPVEPTLTRAEEAEWVPLKNLEGMFEKTNSLSFKVDGEDQAAQMYLYYIDQADMANQIAVEFNVEKGDGSGISEIESSNASTRYFNLQGTEVENPSCGVYIRVADGKASKVIL